MPPTAPKKAAPGDVSRLLHALGQSDSAADELFQRVYHELKQMARRRMARESAADTLTPTALVHDTYVRLFGQRVPQWENRRHFFAAAAEAMRRILIESARRRNADRRRSVRSDITIDAIAGTPEDPDGGLLVVDAALESLESLDPQMAAIVKLRFYGGLTVEETAELMEISPRSVNRGWTAARAWLIRAVG